ncbi:DUF1752 domain-containing protein [Mycena chlorophos]|uniref:DUF1752 domain-containing protein n=1 Tax=Mycena chlorophos TaxID=658473 RepID=A0A8H6T114_MYCCL|nr:DUF1752 domain-containing protein [Mycena chlorophos]
MVSVGASYPALTCCRLPAELWGLSESEEEGRRALGSNLFPSNHHHHTPTMAQYLPVLLVSVSTNAVPDDSSLEPLPRGQVDYLSHQWEEEDVWRSWRSMTRQKNEIANGMRLENASWRTWWKQRNKLKTISPETLNWLKDSDVTWLYGPLHTAVDWSPPPKPKPDPTEVGKESSTEDKLDLAQAKHRSILKHRSVAELLQSDLPASPLFSPAESDDSNDSNSDDNPTDVRPVRPPLLHTKSAPHIHPPTHPHLRKPSPPRVLPPAMAAASPDSSRAASSRRHITFNTFVEQCIAIDSPRRYPPPAAPSSSDFIAEDGMIINNPTRAWDGRTSGRYLATASEDDDDDDEMSSSWATNESALSSDSDDALEICLPRSRSGSRSSGSSKSVVALSNNKQPSSGKTIAPIAPTRLKTTGVGNSWAGGAWVGTRDLEDHNEDTHLSRTGATVNLLASAATNTLVSAFDDDDEEEGEVFTHESSYFSADADAYDYFAGPDIGVEFAAPAREPRGRRGSSGAEIVEIEGTTSPLRAGRERERSRSRSRSKSRSRSRTPSPALISAATPSSPPNANAGVSTTRSGLLSPPPVPPRGRDSSVSPSTSTSSSSAGRGRSVTRTASTSGSDRDRSRSGSSHTSPLGSLSPEYSGVRTSVSGDFGIGGGAGLKGGGRWKGEDRLSPEAMTPSPSLSPSAEDDNSNSGSSGVTAGQAAPTVVPEDNARPSVTPANSPVAALRAPPAYVSKAGSVGSAGSSSSSSSSTASSSASSASSTRKSTPSKSDPGFGTTAASTKTLSLPQPHLDMLNVPVDLFMEEDFLRKQAQTPANSPVVRTRPSPRIPDASAPVKGASPPPPSSTAKSISPPKTRPKPPNGSIDNSNTVTVSKSMPGPGPTSPAKPSFSVGTPVMSVPVQPSGAGSPSESALQRTLANGHVNGVLGSPSPSPSSSSFSPSRGVLDAHPQTPSPPVAGAGAAAPGAAGEGNTIVGKAVGMVGAYFGLWNNNSATAPPSTAASATTG